MWIPESIYSKLPIIYGAAGIALIPAFGMNGPSVVSAVLLVAAGALTAMWRHRHRQEPEAPETTLSQQWAERRARRIESMGGDMESDLF